MELNFLYMIRPKNIILDIKRSSCSRYIFYMDYSRVTLQRYLLSVQFNFFVFCFSSTVLICFVCLFGVALCAASAHYLFVKISLWIPYEDTSFIKTVHLHMHNRCYLAYICKYFLTGNHMFKTHIISSVVILLPKID